MNEIQASALARLRAADPVSLRPDPSGPYARAMLEHVLAAADTATRSRARPIRRWIAAGSVGSRLSARRWVFVAVGVACLTVAASVPVVIAFDSGPAYAVSVNPDGSVTFTVHNLSRNLDGAAARLRAAGVPAVVVPAQPPGACTPSQERADVLGVITDSRNARAPREERATVTVHPDKLPAGEVVAFAVQHVKTRDSDFFVLFTGLYDAPGPTCIILPPVPQPPGARK